MSYRRAWLLVDEVNRCFRDRVVDTLPGGGRERGARLTQLGRDLLTDYRRVEADAAVAAENGAYRRLVAALRDVPLARHS